MTSSEPSGFFGERFERGATQPERGPSIHRTGAKALVEPDRERVPVEDVPLEPPAVALERDTGKMGKECAANAFFSRFWIDEEILEEESSLCEERGIVVKEQSESGRCPIGPGDQHFGGGVIAEECRPQPVFCRYALVAKLLVYREILNESQYQG